MKLDLKSLDLPTGWCTYMLTCLDGSYYVGLTNDLPQRLQDQSIGKGPIYTRTKKPRLLVWFESHPDRQAAAARELNSKPGPARRNTPWPEAA